MISLSSLVLSFSVALGALALPGDLSKRQTITSPQTGTYDGYYYSFWTNGAGSVSYQNTGAGAYSVTWSNANGGDFTAGVGWNPGSAQAITFDASFKPNGNAYLAVYGWSENPLVEYYILENYGDYNPGSAMTKVGSLTSDGSTYTVYTHTQTNQPSIEGTSTFQQYWSIRSSLRSSGTVTTANHFNYWNSIGLKLGSFNYQILVTEGYESSGSSSVTVSKGSGSAPPPPPPPSGPTSTTTTAGSKPTGSCSALYGQCGGNGWTGATCCSSGTCKYSNAWYSQCL
ncbi:glycoside hydrolase family 11 xylanase [Xylogone sp. PMI_703]|nr:glycoside hydrolase family 11 xylanase [Xylogone sp. PMI_703]